MKILSLILIALPCFATDSPYTAAVKATTGLISYYRLGDGGSTQSDTTATNTLTASGSPAVGVVGPSSYENPPDGAVDTSAGNYVAASSTPFNFQYSDTFSGVGFAYDRCIGGGSLFGKMGGSPFTGYVVAIDSNHKVEVYLISSTVGGTYIHGVTTQTIACSTWTHIAFTYSGNHLASGIKIYINGALATFTADQNTLGTNTIQNATSLAIGGRTGNSFRFAGYLDEWAIFSTELSAATVLGLYGSSQLTRPNNTSNYCQGSGALIAKDYDIGGDFDDAEDDALFASLQRQGCITPLLVTTVSTFARSPASAQAIYSYSGFTPGIGALTTGADSGASNYANYIANQFNFTTPRASYTTAVIQWRTYLAAAADASVIALLTGTATNIAAVLASPGDGIDARTGLALWQAKVIRLDWVGGIWPTGTEFNLSGDPTAANYVIGALQGASPPVPVVFFGIEIGNQISIGASLSTYLSTVSNPIAYGWACGTATCGSGAANSAAHANWSGIAMLAESFGITTILNYGGQDGTCTINSSTGANSFSASAGTCSYVTAKYNNVSGASNWYSPVLDNLIRREQHMPTMGLFQ